MFKTTILLAICMLPFSISATNAQDPTTSITIGNTEYAVSSITVTKSASMQLADMDSSTLEPAIQTTYMPAGTAIILLEKFAKDRSRRRLQLALTQTGLLVYVRTGAIHIFDPDTISLLLNANQKIAIAVSKLPIPTETYGEITITPSEIYRFEHGPADKISIVLGADKMGDRYISEEVVAVDVSSFAIVDSESLKFSAFGKPFIPYDISEDISRIVEGMIALRDEPEARSRLIERVKSGRFVTSKSCDDEISLNAEFGGKFGAEFDKFFSPLTINLGISGSYNKNTVFRRGTEFEVKRFSRGKSILEYKFDYIYQDQNCAHPIGRSVLTVKEGANRKAAYASDLGLSGQNTKNLLLQYSCRSEFEDLIDYLSRQANLTSDAAAFTIAWFARYESPQNAATCSN